ncbi:BON domain-containing protein [Paraburkholderia pallida]|uniref:BON domain-containing protein n=1 Tax=Paraburkholderia pallida TaxID=2547399 RepID=A0A4P7D4M5_9BURK|nr:BON domain-containing protein [Paraburkholderia pallida]QBR03751.1 BON domain-containing protein [Paraburkholderia pallida]
MKPLVKRLAIGLSATFLFAGQSAMTFAQTPASTPHASRAEARKANHILEHNVLIALEKEKLDVVDVRVIAKHGDVGLDGEVPNSTDIDKAATIAGQVPGVNSVKNYLTVYEEGGH